MEFPSGNQQQPVVMGLTVATVAHPSLMTAMLSFFPLPFLSSVYYSHTLLLVRMQNHEATLEKQFDNNPKETKTYVHINTLIQISTAISLYAQQGIIGLHSVL